ncbi:DNA-3-methyladenine glycosylase [Actinotalea sp. K2]|uniref:DNA-3-methyladenine glycosylase n=1 Tax=Actinotalea sp. K2 TaxID=2939438 RepID=UPI00201783EA|nr:DNA-3-methyladenine glycosylase [Actinotalea sp. K2]MCL3860075.1 DNA-3-methyladenine glycosylase [Actinotalea sp. K2]
MSPSPAHGALLRRADLEGPVLAVAPRLLGTHLTTVLRDGIVTVRVTEVEAYDGAEDPGSHAFRGRTDRNAVMFGPAGRLYVYRHLGLHHCANVVTGRPGGASAVLVRAGEVVEGKDLARARRTLSGVARTDVDLARGPARLAVALGIDLALGGTDVLDAGSPVHLTEGTAPATWSMGPRVGVAGPGGDAERFPWRFWLPHEPTVSAYRPGRAARPDRASGASRAARTSPRDGAGTAH